MIVLVWQKCVFFNVFSVNYGKMYSVFLFATMIVHFCG